MVVDTSLDEIDFCDTILNMSFKDFCTLCAEKGVDYSLLISSLTVCCFGLYCQFSLDKKNKK